MKKHRPYMHLERLNHRNVNGIDVGEVYIFPKLDGGNGVVWWDGEKVCVGSRRVILDGIERENFGFHAYIHEPDRLASLEKFFQQYPSWIIYGEWLVPHTLKTYREDAWRDLYVFDVFDTDRRAYLHYDEYSPMASEVFKVIPPLAIANSPTPEQLLKLVNTNTYLIEDNAGTGEGIVLKNYGWINTQAEQIWAKVVRNAFKEDNRRAFGVPEIGAGFQVEAAIAEKFVTAHLVNKTRAKIVNEYMANFGALPTAKWKQMAKVVEEDNRKVIIPRLLQTVYSDLIDEEAWAFVKEFKDPTINFKRLRQFTLQQVKKYAEDLF